MKSYSDISQSKKLAEFLPLESADMWWNFYSVTTDDTTPQIIHISTPWVGSFNWNNESDNIPCWSFAALLDVIRKCCERFELTLRADKRYNIFGTASNDFVYHSFDEHPEGIDNSIDACYEMILKLHEEKLL